MASTTFVDGSTVIVAAWLNDTNNLVYNGVFQSSNITITGSLTAPVVKASSSLTLQTNGTTPAIFADTSQNVGLGTNSLISGFKVTTNGSAIANGSFTSYGSDPNLSTGSSRTFMDFSGSTGRIGTATGTGSGGSLALYVNNSSVATLDSSGNLGTNGNVTSSGAVTGNNLFGQSQTWTNVTSSRAFGTTYTNSTTRPIMVSVWGSSTSVAEGYVSCSINGTQVARNGCDTTNYNNIDPGLTIIVPPSATYNISSNCSLSGWFELR